jgi:hypothetical protein
MSAAKDIHAFPRPAVFDEDGGIFGEGEFRWGQPGMSLRDWFAGQALSGMLASGRDQSIAVQAAGWKFHSRELSEVAYAVADDMLTSRAKGEA